MSTGDAKHPPGLADGDEALDEYFDSLLSAGEGPTAAVREGDRARTTADGASLWVQAFMVHNLALALPQERVTAVVPMPVLERPRGPAPLWLLGLAAVANERVRVADISAIVFPGALQRRLARAPARAYGQLIVVGGTDLAIAVNRVHAPTAVGRADVVWREPGAQQRPWLLGICHDPLCALLDGDVLARRLAGSASGTHVI